MSGRAFNLGAEPLLLPECEQATAKIIERIAAQRTLPEGPQAWRELEFEVALGPKTITRYVWVLAAILRARGLTWDEIAAHPWVSGKLSEAVLRNKHSRTRLPTQQSFGELVEWYQAEIRRQWDRLMAEQARRDSLNIRDVCLQVVQDCARTQRRLRAGQQDLDFDDKVPLTAEQLVLEGYRMRVLKDSTDVLERIYKLLRLTTGNPTEITATPAEARAAETGAEASDALWERIEAKRAELLALRGGA